LSNEEHIVGNASFIAFEGSAGGSAQDIAIGGKGGIVTRTDKSFREAFPVVSASKMSAGGKECGDISVAGLQYPSRGLVGKFAPSVCADTLKGHPFGDFRLKTVYNSDLNPVLILPPACREEVAGGRDQDRSGNTSPESVDRRY
jgi:hypothetical protein